MNRDKITAKQFKDQIPKYMNWKVRKWFINLSATSAMMSTLSKRSVIFCSWIWTSWEINTYRKEFKIYRERCYCYHSHGHTTDTSCFSLVGNAANKYHLKLKESLLILKMKPSLNVAKESMPLYLFEMTHNSVWKYQFNLTMVTNCINSLISMSLLL